MTRNRVKAAICLGLASLGQLSAADCSRAELLETVEEWMMGVQMGLAAPLGQRGNVADSFSYIENNKEADITAGVMFNIMLLDHNRTIIDLEQCASYTEIIAANPGNYKPFVFGTQIRQDPNSNHDIYLVDTIVSTTGAGWFFNATQTLHYARQEDWGVLPVDRRSSRATLRAAADAYLDMWSNKSAIDAIPFGSPCNRLEGSVYLNCTDGIPTNNTQAPNSNRRYVIDEEVGSVSVLCNFEHLDNAPDSHEFRLEGGKIRYVHSITVGDSSKFNFTAPSPALKQ